MKISLHNKVGSKYKKVMEKVKFITKQNLSKFPVSKKWNMNFNIKTSHHKDEQIECSVSVRRPKMKEIFVKKISTDINMAIKECVYALEQIVRSEKRGLRTKLSYVRIKK